MQDDIIVLKDEGDAISYLAGAPITAYLHTAPIDK
jgi:hypothetical protein